MSALSNKVDSGGVFGDAEMPLVSCIMPTANREKFVPQAVRYFLRQDYPNKELIIVDDGLNSVEFLLPVLPSVRYKRLSAATVTGEKRNYACEMSNGEIILHWDDDDWYAKDWISSQVRVLIASNAQIGGVSKVYFYDPTIQKSWMYVYPPDDLPWVCGASMIYYKEFWKRHPFKNIKIGEDNSFVWDGRAKIVAHDYREGLVAIVHSQNTSPKDTDNIRWRPVPVSAIESIIKDDLSFYRQL